MRVTSNTYSEFILTGSQSAQQRIATLQQEISTGNSVTAASDNPLAFEQASRAQTDIAQLGAYSTAINQATTLTTANNSAMTQLHQVVAQAGEYATSVSGTMTPAQMQNIGTQMNTLLSQLTSVVNQQANGVYLFGGTANQPPIDTTTGTYNTNTNGSSNAIEVSPGNAITTGLLAGRPGSPAVDGFLYDSTSGIDVMATLKQAVTDLNAGNAAAVQGTDLPALNKALDHISMYVGSTAADLSAVSVASSINKQQLTSQGNQLNVLTQTNLPVASVQLQQIQTQYQATMQAGSKVLNLSILDYLH